LKCPNMAWVLILLFVVVALGCCLAGYFLSRKQVNLAFLSIGVDYFQILAIFANSKVGAVGPCVYARARVCVTV
jgi:hypothetical protein